MTPWHLILSTRTFRKQPSDQRQGTLHMPKAQGADRKKNPDRPFARVMGLLGSAKLASHAQASLTAVTKA